MLNILPDTDRDQEQNRTALSAGRPVAMHAGTQYYLSRQNTGAAYSMHSFRDPWQTQLVHLNCKLEDVVETVSSH
jgi:hypothetical protein